MPRTYSQDHWSPTRNTRNIAAVPVMALIIITPTILFAVNASMTSVQSGLLFQKIWGGIDNTEVGNGVAVDSWGNIYVTGYTFSFGPGNLTAHTGVSLLKYDSMGTLVWQRIWSGNGSGGDIGSAVAVDSSGDAVVTGFVEQSPPYTLGYPNGTIGAPSFSLGVPSFTLDTPTFLPYTPTGTVQTPSGSESNTGSKVNDEFLVKFTPLSYTENYIENPVDIFGLPPIEFYGLIGGAVVLIGALTTVLFQRRKRRLAASKSTENANNH